MECVVDMRRLSQKKEGRQWPPELLEFAAITDQASAICHLLNKETDRGCALIGGAALDEVLGALLTTFFIDDKDVCKSLLHSPGAPNGTFSSRILLCRGIGLISDDLYRDIDIVRHIRNQAAHFDRRRNHGHDFTFRRQDIADKCHTFRSIPSEVLDQLPARGAFETFVSLAAALMGENAIIWKASSDKFLARQMLMEFVPKIGVKVKRHLNTILKSNGGISRRTK